MIRYYKYDIDDPRPDRTEYRRHMICAGISIIDNIMGKSRYPGMRYYYAAAAIAALGFCFDDLQAIRKGIRRAGHDPYHAINYADFRTINNLWMLISSAYILW